MIHGLSNALKHKRGYYKSHDWTDGCVAVSNADMAENRRRGPSVLLANRIQIVLPEGSIVN